MEDLILSIMERAGQQMPELITIDEDYGQLMYDGNTDNYPVVFPCALFGNIELTWTTSGSIQQGKGTFLVRLAMDCYHDTQLGSGTEDWIRERLQMNGRLCRILHNYHHSRDISPLERIKSVDYTLQGPGNIKVYETTYAFEICDRSITTPL